MTFTVSADQFNHVPIPTAVTYGTRLERVVAMLAENLVPMLRTWDIPGSIVFYTSVLGFTCEAGGHEEGWASLTCGGVSIMLSGPNEHEGDTAPCFTGSLYFRVWDVVGLWSQLKVRARVCYPLDDFEYGMREFAIYDNNGYLLQFGEEIDGHRGSRGRKRSASSERAKFMHNGQRVGHDSAAEYSAKCGGNQDAVTGSIFVAFVGEANDQNWR